ncbi:hypothetical protein ANANG_G00053750 [Anguilla anguilla]|uniref:Telomere-associated protein Rif1 N-terminal domain-containing protein n=1 Tax=Anguilla anguilla TaxID=7936 RepID=A0A9D3S6A3_ANGAN|nr:hypothetical protein ANANG_G00053750 [Anguilla anguilla]
MSRNAEAIENGEHLWRMWSIVVNPLTDTITQTNEVNQGDALEHNYTALLRALMFPVTHLLIGHALSQMTQKSLLSTWSRLYRAFARCSALVATAEENVCCEELCAKMAAVLDSKVLSNPSTLEAVASLLLVVIECVDFTPYTPHYQKTKSPHTPLGWVRKKNKALGNLSTFQALLVLALESFLSALESFLSRDAPETGRRRAALACPPAGRARSSSPFCRLSSATWRWAPPSWGHSPPCLHPSPASTNTPGDLRMNSRSSSPVLDQSWKSCWARFWAACRRAPLWCSMTSCWPSWRPCCALFPHRSKPLRNLATQFWNATFAHAPTLTYPEDLK